MKRFTVLVLMFLLTLQSASAAVVDRVSPYFGDYLFIYNDSDSNQTVSPLSAAQLSSSVMYSVLEESTEPVQRYWHPEHHLSGELAGRFSPLPENSRNHTMQYSVATVSEPEIGDTLSYLVTDLVLGEKISKDFIYLAAGDYCNVLVEPDANGNPKLTAADAQKIVTEFDTHIQPFMVENFGDYYTYLGLYLGRYLEYSKNTAMDILLYDIQDGFDNDTVRVYVGGYTDTGDFVSEQLKGNGNERGILHIDIYPLMGLSGNPNVEKAFSTMVHEFQHQINISDSLFDYLTGKTDEQNNELWWDEAFSMAAEHLYTGAPLTNRISGYNRAGNKVPLRCGLTLDYTNYEQNNNDVASNYSTAYLFGQYLRCQTKHLKGGGNQIYRTVLEQTGTDYTAILQGLSSIGYEHTPTSFLQLYQNFRMATILKEQTGPYGFSGEEAFAGLVDNAYTGGEDLTLKPGSAIVLKNPRNYLPEEGLSCVSFSERDDFTYEINPISATTVNLTEGVSPPCGVTLFAAGYRQNGSLSGVVLPQRISESENYSYQLPSDTASVKFFLFSSDGNLKPLAYAEP